MMTLNPKINKVQSKTNCKANCDAISQFTEKNISDYTQPNFNSRSLVYYQSIPLEDMSDREFIKAITNS